MADRHFHLFRAGMGRYPAVDVSLRLDVLVEALTHYYDKSDTFSFVTTSDQAQDERNGIIVSDLKIDDGSVSILLVRGDPGRTMPSFVNLKSRRVVTIKSDEPGSVRGSSCHIVISKREVAKGSDSGTYRMVIEQAPGIGRVLARDFLGSLLTRFAADHPERFVAEKKRKSKGQKPEKIDYRPTVRFHPHQNANLKEDLVDGRIGGFKLVHGSTEFTGEASAPRIEKLDVQLHAKIVPTNDFLGVKTLVENLRGALSNVDFDRLKL